MSSFVHLDFRIEEERWNGVTSLADKLETWISKTLELEDSVGELVSLSIVLSGNEAVETLNSRWREKPKPTNILSFPAPDGEVCDEGNRYLGDLILAFEVVTAEANEQGKALETHLCHLVIHGVLHLLGYDHDEDTSAETMEKLEIMVMKGLGLPNPYVETTV